VSGCALADRAAGGYNQLAFDDSPTGGRIELSTTAAQTRLQLGHLLNQNDNQRMQPRGHGVDLTTAGWGALRAGAGLLVSAHGKPGSAAGGASLESREPQTQAEQSQELLHTLAESAQKHRAMGAGEPNVVGAKAGDSARQLVNEQALYAAIKSLAGVAQRAESGASGEGSIGGGAGRVTAWSRPDLVVAAPAGIAAFTPAALFASAGNTLTAVAGQDLQLAAQANQAWAIKGGLVFYTYGKATNASKPNTETGIRLHAATGNVNWVSKDFKEPSDTVQINLSRLAVEGDDTDSIGKLCLRINGGGKHCDHRHIHFYFIDLLNDVPLEPASQFPTIDNKTFRRMEFVRETRIVNEHPVLVSVGARQSTTPLTLTVDHTFHR